MAMPWRRWWCAARPHRHEGGAQGPAQKGTRVTFLASDETFKNVTVYDFDKLEHRYRELASSTAACASCCATSAATR
jgi:DNA gyrase/topoisomerase IV subunit B